ncbi:hypothetical protein EZS27_027079 [termite gut metagenome]|uniref:Uncharacterized protein n=1 Tax=termite gut metagenome TaxID=433724 RepID=A0A5J4QQV9_9ZZZZ
MVGLIILTSYNNISLPVIVYDNQPSESEQMVAKEVCRYLYLRTGKFAEQIGLKSDLDDKGRVKTAYPARQSKEQLKEQKMNQTVVIH